MYLNAKKMLESTSDSELDFGNLFFGLLYGTDVIFSSITQEGVILTKDLSRLFLEAPVVKKSTFSFTPAALKYFGMDVFHAFKGSVCVASGRLYRLQKSEMTLSEIVDKSQKAKAFGSFDDTRGLLVLSRLLWHISMLSERYCFTAYQSVHFYLFVHGTEGFFLKNELKGQAVQLSLDWVFKKVEVDIVPITHKEISDNSYFIFNCAME